MKIKSTILIFITCLFLVMFINTIAASESTGTQNINETNIDEIKVPGTFDTLNHEIRSAKNNLTLDKDYKFNKDTDYWHTAGLDLRSNFELDGQGHTIDADGQSRIFLISSKNIVIKNLNLLNGFHTKNGGAVIIDDWASNIVFDNCTFANNNAKIFGGAIYSITDNVKIKNCVFNNNSAKYGGAGLFEIPADIFNSNFTGNNAEIAGAVMNGGRVDIKFGTVYEYTGSKKALIEGCEFNNNTATRIGALDCESYSNITGCRFTGNSATNYGALKMNYGNLRDSEFNNNSAINSVGAFGSTILDNIVNCIFINNNAKDSGAIMVRHFNNIKGCKMENNTASKLGGAIYIMPGFLDYEYQLSNNEFKNNNAEEGSSLYCGRDVVFLNNKFEDDLLNSTQIKLYNGAKITYL